MQARLFSAPSPSISMPTKCLNASFDFGKLTMTSLPFHNISLTHTAKLNGNLFLPLAGKENKHCEAVQAKLLTWMEDMGLASSNSNNPILYAVYKKAIQLKAA